MLGTIAVVYARISAKGRKRAGKMMVMSNKKGTLRNKDN